MLVQFAQFSIIKTATIVSCSRYNLCKAKHQFLESFYSRFYIVFSFKAPLAPHCVLTNSYHYLRCKTEPKSMIYHVVISHSTAAYIDALLFPAYCTLLGNAHETHYWPKTSCRCHLQRVGWILLDFLAECRCLSTTV